MPCVTGIKQNQHTQGGERSGHCSTLINTGWPRCRPRSPSHRACGARTLQRACRRKRGRARPAQAGAAQRRRGRTAAGSAASLLWVRVHVVVVAHLCCVRREG